MTVTIVSGSAERLEEIGPSRQNRSVRKAAALLRAVAANSRGASVSALARDAGLPRATALRMIEALIAERLLARLPDDRIVLGADLFQLARTADVTELMIDASRDVLEDLMTAVQETVTLTVILPDGTPALVRQVDGPFLLGLTSWVGRPLPLHASSSGKLVLAHARPARVAAFLRMPLQRLASRTIVDRDQLQAELADIRRNGWCEIEDELEDGVSSMSMAVLVDGALFGTVNVSGPAARFDAQARQGCLPALRTACDTIVRRLT